MKITLNKKLSVSFKESDNSLDKFDISILNCLSENSRVSYADLSEKIGLSRDAIKYRINKLIEKKIITDFSISVNPNLIGLNNMRIVNISLNDSAQMKTVLTYFKKSPFVTQYFQTIGNWDFMVIFITKDDNHLSVQLNGLKKHFDIKEMQIVNVIQNE